MTDAPLQLAESLDSLVVDDTVPDEEAASVHAIQHRADLRAASQAVTAAERQVSAIRAERLPTLSVFADQGATGKSFDHMLNTFTWGVQASLPIFDGLRREGRAEEQRAVAAEASVRRRDLEQQAAAEVRSAVLDLRSAREQMGAARERLRGTLVAPRYPHESRAPHPR